MSEPADPHPSGFAFTRRQFGVIVAGGAAAVAVGSQLLSAPRAPGLAVSFPAARTSFGTVRIERAKRMARFGTGTFPAAAGGTVTDHGHGPVPADPSRAPLNLTWGDVVVLWLGVQNATGAPLYVSPGQLRLRVPSDGTTVTLRNSAAALLEVRPGASATTWVSYLAPAEAGSGFHADFTDPALDNVLTLPIPGEIAVAQARSDGEPWAV
jgi:hypothetical protein